MMSNAAVTSVRDWPRQHPACGAQVVLDLYECETAHLDDLPWVKSTLMNAARAAGATIVETVFHKFAPWGISGVVVIAESHLAIHVWPEKRYAAIDVFTCGENVLTKVATAFLKREFRSKRSVQRQFRRGDRCEPRRGADKAGDCHESATSLGETPAEAAEPISAQLSGNAGPLEA